MNYKPVIMSYTVLHYGIDYLPYALRSIYDHVDRLNIIYTPHPSHGHNTNAAPPETRDELLNAAFEYDPDKKISWYETDWIKQEGQQRATAVQICKQNGADLVLVVDYDEVWPAATLERALDFAWKYNSARNWLINFTHFWRSFDYACKDNNWPVRIIDLRRDDETVDYIPTELGDIYHFGYAVTDEIMHYKWLIHGHKNEMRPGWWDKWNAWPPAEDCHPTNGLKDNGEGWWNPKPFNKQQLPKLMHSHPFYEMERID